MKQYILTKEDAVTVYFKCQDRTGCIYTSIKEDAMKFESRTNAIDFNHKKLYGECKVVEYTSNIAEQIKNGSKPDVMNSILVDLIKEVYQRAYNDGYAEIYNAEFVGEDKSKLIETEGLDNILNDVVKKYCS